MSPTSYLTAPPRGERRRLVKAFGSVNEVAELMVYEKRTCTTCKNLALMLEERGIDFDRVDYHVEPLSEAEIRELVRKTGRPARELFRAREPVHEELGLGARDVDDDEAIRLMAEYPQLMQRPVVVRGDRAVLGRPVERVLELLD
jgi:arsenate reductase (glutaredoxin)